MSSKFVLSENDAEFKAEIERAAGEAIGILERDMEKYISGDLYPADYQNGRYEPVPNGDLKNHAWEEGFWTGQLYLPVKMQK